MKSKRRNINEVRALMQKVCDSGMFLSEYAREHNINKKTLYSYNHKLNKAGIKLKRSDVPEQIEQEPIDPTPLHYCPHCGAHLRPYVEALRRMNNAKINLGKRGL